MNSEGPTDDLLTSSYDYHLPPELIADQPVKRREESRLMVVRGENQPPLHRHFYDLPEFLRAGDLLVLNDSKVLPARLFGQRQPGGGACEILLLHPLESGPSKQPCWTALVRPGKKLKPGVIIEFAPNFSAEVLNSSTGGERDLRFSYPGDFREALEIHGNMPLPPYILARRGEKLSRPEDRERYQTIYARHEGSVAAPTAGLHFSAGLMTRLEEMGVEFARVTLHVGAGTFQPIATDRIDEHPMHFENYEIAVPAAEAINRARQEGRRVIAVGTTSVRTLESAAGDHGNVQGGFGSTKLMIRPGYEFRIIDALITNFHLPRSTLLCLVAALTGRHRLLELYEEAVRADYRFYSYGDAMMVVK